MYKIAAIIGGVLLLAGVALAGTMTSLGSSNTPTLGTTSLPASTVEDDRGREQEQRGRADEPGEDVSGPCDEAEHANDPRCTGTAAAPRGGDDAEDDRGGDNSGPGSSSSGPSESSGHGGEDGGNSGHGGQGEDD